MCQPWLTHTDCQGIGLKGGEEQGNLGDILYRGELLVHGLASSTS